MITPSASSTYIFVYEVASGIVLRNRTISGASTVLSMAPDGSRFMAGMTMYDTATLGIMAQENNANAPFTFTGAFNTLQNIGGSAFTPDGSTLYAAFNVAAFVFAWWRMPELTGRSLEQIEGQLHQGKFRPKDFARVPADSTEGVAQASRT